jgi:hypothetical protein
MNGKVRVANKVLPRTNPDFVSYSSFDAQNGDIEKNFAHALEYIQAQLAPKPRISGKRVFIGEYGMPLLGNSAEAQDILARHVMRAGLKWGCPFVLYWEMYNNEVTPDGRQRGFWLIDDHGIKQPVYFTHQKFYAKARACVADFTVTNRRVPSREEFGLAALAWLPVARWRDEKSVLNKLRVHRDFVAPFFPPLAKGGQGGWPRHDQSQGLPTLSPFENLSPHHFQHPLHPSREAGSVVFDFQGSRPTPPGPPFARGGKDRSLASSVDRAQQKHAPRNRPSSTVNTNFSSPRSNPRRPSGAWHAVRGQVARSLESLSPLRSSDLRWDQSGTVRRAYDAFAPRWNPAMPFLWFPGSHSSQSWKLRSAARPGFGSPCQWPGHRHVARKEHCKVSLVIFLARFAIGTIIRPSFSADINPVIRNCHLSLGEG